MRKKIKLVTKLKWWLGKDNNNETKLAALLGYRSPNTIKNWLKSGEIPYYITDKLEQIIE